MIYGAAALVIALCVVLSVAGLKALRSGKKESSQDRPEKKVSFQDVPEVKEFEREEGAKITFGEKEMGHKPVQQPRSLPASLRGHSEEAKKRWESKEEKVPKSIPTTMRMGFGLLPVETRIYNAWFANKIDDEIFEAFDAISEKNKKRQIDSAKFDEYTGLIENYIAGKIDRATLIQRKAVYEK